MKRRRGFTLLEIFLCLTLLTLIGGALLFGIKEMLDHHRVAVAVKELEGELKQMQSLAVTYQSDMQLQLYRTQGQLYFRGHTNEPRALFHPHSLKGIAQIQVDQTPLTSPFTLTVYASGRISPPCRLTLSNRQASHSLDLTSPLRIK